MGPVLLAAALVGVGVWWSIRPPAEAPKPTLTITKVEPVAPAAPKVVVKELAPVKTITLRRPKPAPVEGAPAAEPEGEVVADDAPIDILDVPEAERQPLVDQAHAVIDDLNEACGHAVPAGGLQVMAAVTVDETGLREVDLSGYETDGERTWASRMSIPPMLLVCLDEVIWDQDWPTFDGGVRFALTLPMEPAEE